MKEFEMSEKTLKQQARTIIRTSVRNYIVFGINKNGAPYVGVFEWHSIIKRGNQHNKTYFNNMYTCKYYKTCTKKECNKEYLRIRGYMPLYSVYEALEHTLYSCLDISIDQVLNMVKGEGRYSC